ncbi:class I SAM-dependent methyltransferase [Aduncisulcus paluster]|uniref:Class I SAM-dependent methyltransferase n=1 Tax=Aduncisulcus paluster TaxID=2918883 RepID=A0ABQ5KQB1_9EUKA|nr:class I SAM-dependent methyltransferase [Aduncisulcus paluster]
MEDNTFDGAILFNILDNLHPEDGKLLIGELCRVLKSGAALLLKLNPVFEEAVFEEDDEFKKIGENCYEEESGLVFWNMDEAVINEILEGHFEYVDGYDIDMQDFDTVNRMYWLKKI